MNYKITLSLIVIITILFQNCTPTNSTSKTEVESTKTVDNQSQSFEINDFITKWENNKTYTLAVLEAMPEEHYDFQPTEEIKSFKAQAAHIVSSFNFQMEFIGYPNLAKVDETSKASVIESYTEIFDVIIAHLKTLDTKNLGEEITPFYGRSTKSRMLNLMDNHLAHHRGQLTVYLRLKGIKPPKYVGW
jgi:uncharacterized damage-inducible protein DinB